MIDPKEVLCTYTLFGTLIISDSKGSTENITGEDLEAYKPRHWKLTKVRGVWEAYPPFVRTSPDTVLIEGFPIRYYLGVKNGEHKIIAENAYTQKEVGLRVQAQLLYYLCYERYLI